MRRAPIDVINRSPAVPILLGFGTAAAGHALCIAVSVATALVSSVLLQTPEGDRAEARAGIAIIVIAVAMLTLLETILLTVGIVVVRRRNNRRQFGIGLLIGWVTGVLILTLRFASMLS